MVFFFTFSRNQREDNLDPSSRRYCVINFREGNKEKKKMEAFPPENGGHLHLCALRSRKEKQAGMMDERRGSRFQSICHPQEAGLMSRWIAQLLVDRLID